jgi:hypothetical protein
MLKESSGKVLQLVVEVWCVEAFWSISEVHELFIEGAALLQEYPGKENVR